MRNPWLRLRGHSAASGRVVVTAYDSDKVECLDLRTGRLVWEVPRKDTDLYVGGVVNDKVLVVSQDRVRAYHLHKIDPNAANAPQLAWESSEAIPTPTGHGAVGKTVYFVPVRQPNAGKETVPAAEIWAINIENGKVEPKVVARKRGDNGELARYGLGNLVFQIIVGNDQRANRGPQIAAASCDRLRHRRLQPGIVSGIGLWMGRHEAFRLEAKAAMFLFCSNAVNHLRKISPLILGC